MGDASMKSLRRRFSLTWNQVWIAALSCLALTHPVPGSAGAPGGGASSTEMAATSLRMALEAAWQRAVQATESRGRQALAKADQAIAQSLLAAAPVLSLGQREALAGAASASRETEAGVSLPLWWPGQRSVGARAAEFASTWALAFDQADRLRLAGQLREALAMVHLAAAEVEQSHQRAKIMGQLATDVERRVSAGDLAPADAMAARAASLAAEAQLGEARLTYEDRQRQWRLLTGMAPLKFASSSVPALTEVPDAHPELVLARAAIDLGQGRADLLRLQRSDAPQLALGLRQEQLSEGKGSLSSFGLSVRIPMGSELYQRPRLERALGELEAARTQAERIHARLVSDLAGAQRQLAESLSLLELAQERTALLGERARLVDQSFKAGETALPEMLRTLAAAADARSALARQRVSHQLAISRLEQALGFLP